MNLSDVQERSLRVYAYSLTRSHHDADDLMQDTYLRAIKKQDKYVDGNYYGWIKTVMYNVFVSQYRKKIRRIKHYENYRQHNPKSFVHNETHIDQEIDPKITEAMEKVNSDFTDMIYDISQEMSYKEIARKHDLPLGTVMSRLCRGRKRVQELLEV